MLKDIQPSMLNGTMEPDESFFQDKNKKRHVNKKIENTKGRSTKEKNSVSGLLEWGGKLKTLIISDTTVKTLKPLISEMVETGVIIITNKRDAYNGLDNSFRHEAVNHNEGPYVKGIVYIYMNEGFWSQLKRGIFEIYHYASANHLHRYTNESSYRYNAAGTNGVYRFGNTFKKTPWQVNL